VLRKLLARGEGEEQELDVALVRERLAEDASGWDGCLCGQIGEERVGRGHVFTRCGLPDRDYLRRATYAYRAHSASGGSQSGRYDGLDRVVEKDLGPGGADAVDVLESDAAEARDRQDRVLDIRLGTDSGLRLLSDAANQGRARLPAVIVLTAYDYPQYAEAALNLGAAGFVGAPAVRGGALLERPRLDGLEVLDRRGQQGRQDVGGELDDRRLGWFDADRLRRRELARLRVGRRRDRGRRSARSST